MMIHRMILIAAAGLLLTALAAQLGNPSSSLGQAALAANAPAQSTQAKKPVYQPPLRGAPTRRVGGAMWVRSIPIRSSCAQRRLRLRPWRRVLEYRARPRGARGEVRTRGRRLIPKVLDNDP